MKKLLGLMLGLMLFFQPVFALSLNGVKSSISNFLNEPRKIWIFPPINIKTPLIIIFSVGAIFTLVTAFVFTPSFGMFALFLFALILVLWL